MASPNNGTSKKARQRRARRARQETVKTMRQTTTTTTTPKQTQKRNKRRSARRGARINPYLQALLNPEDCRGCKIPDGRILIPTATWQTFETLTLTANDAGTAGIWVMPRARRGCYKLTTTGANPNTIYWDADATTLSGQMAAAGLYNIGRVVSASLRATYSGNTGTDRGTVCGLQRYVTAANLNTATNGAPVTVNGAINDPYSECFPVRNGCVITYRPMDESEYDGALISDGTYTSSSCLGIICHGMSPGETVMVHICINWEGLPIQGAVGIVGTSAPEPRNDQWLTEASNWASNLLNKVEPAFSQGGSAFVNGIGQKVAAEAINVGKNKLLSEMFSKAMF